MLQNTPKKIDGLRQIVDLAVGHDVVYTIDRAGTLSVFGTNSYGEGGDGLVTPLPALMAIGLPTKAKQVVVNRGYTVVLLDDATLRQWAEGAAMAPIGNVPPVRQIESDSSGAFADVTAKYTIN